MLKIDKTDVFGWESAIRGMRNPMNSWDKSDSDFRACANIIGEGDLKLMKTLVKAGTDHSKFMRMINVTVDITAPMYWWKEFDTYKVGTVRNSCSTMHKIHAKEFEADDFSHEHMIDRFYEDDGIAKYPTRFALNDIITHLNFFREKYIETKDKKWWWQMIQLLPSSYNQKATVQLNYAVLRSIYHSDRKNHKLDEWRIDFMEWIETLPHSELITE